MIDIHAHILPGMDDGPATLSESMAIAEIAVKEGIHTIVATPHCLNGMYVNWHDDILSACKCLNSALAKSHISLRILPGSEARICPEIERELDSGRWYDIYPVSAARTETNVYYGPQ